MAAKRPTGERPKGNSKLAKFIAGGNNPKLTQAESRIAAGKFRDAEKKAGGFKGIGFMDTSGAALGKAKKQAKGPAKAKPSTIKQVATRFGVTAREARDIATAVGNVGAVIRNKSGTGALGGKAKQIGAAAKEIKKQVGETAKAAKTGKKGTPSKQYMTITGDQPARIIAPGSGKKRK